MGGVLLKNEPSLSPFLIFGGGVGPGARKAIISIIIHPPPNKDNTPSPAYWGGLFSASCSGPQPQVQDGSVPSTASSGWQCSPPDLNRELRLAVFPAGPPPRASAGSVPRRASTGSQKIFQIERQKECQKICKQSARKHVRRYARKNARRYAR